MTSIVERFNLTFASGLLTAAGEVACPECGETKLLAISFTLDASAAAMRCPWEHEWPNEAVSAALIDAMRGAVAGAPEAFAEAQRAAAANGGWATIDVPVPDV